MIEIEIRDTVFIDEKEIVDIERLTPNSTDLEIKEAVERYVLGYDDCYYYFFIKRQEKEIYEKVKKLLKNT